MISHTDVGYAQKGGSDCGDVSPVPLGSKESHDPPTVSRWLRAKSLHSTMNEHKMIEMKVQGQTVSKYKGAIHHLGEAFRPLNPYFV